MKIEPRGKYGGVKVHLEPEECQKYLDLAELAKTTPGPGLGPGAVMLTIPLGKEIKKLLKEHPDLLEDKSDEKVAEVLKYEAEKAAKKLALLEQGGEAWKKAKPDGWKEPGVKA